ncbi:MAG: TIGR00730 family Rossman fold protein, partial [Patescibacteria group bacterium]
MPLVYIKDGKVEYRTFVAPAKEKPATPSFAFSFGNGNTGEYRDTWRVFRIMSEFVEGYQFLGEFHHEVTVFGSARLKPSNTYCKKARSLGKMLAEGGYTTITGGGGGIMEAANRGADEGGGESVGINILLPHEQRINAYVKKSIALHYFFTRKVMFATPAQAFVFFPGGYGTLDEFWEIIDLM